MSATTDIRGELRAPIHPERRACTHPCFTPPLMAQSSRKGAGSGREKVSQWKVSGTLGRSRDLSEAVGRGHPSGGEGSRSAGRALPNHGQGQQSWWGLCGHQHKCTGRPPSRVCSWLTREAQTTEAIKTAKLSWETNPLKARTRSCATVGKSPHRPHVSASSAFLKRLHFSYFLFSLCNESTRGQEKTQVTRSKQLARVQ